MTVIAVFEDPSLTEERYEASIRLMMDKSRAENLSDWPVEGLVAHIAGATDDGFRVVDVWESEEALQRFTDALVPVMQELGIEGAPTVTPAHTIVTA